MTEEAPGRGLRVLMITSEWPTAEQPGAGIFVAQQARFLRAAGVDLDVFAFRGARSALRYARAWLRVRNRLARDRYDVVHAQWGQSGVLALPKRFPLVVTFRGSDVLGVVGRRGRYVLSGSLLRFVSRLVARRADRVVVVSDALARRLPGLGSYEVIPSGLDFDRFKPAPKSSARERLGLAANRRWILFGGNPDVAEKRVALARQAVEMLRSKWDVELLIARNVAHDLVPTYMNAADLLLLTSLHEGSPNMVKEALACNVPIVSVDVGDVRERIGRSDRCVVCDDDRAETIAHGIDRVLSDDRPFDGRTLVGDLDERLLCRRLIAVYDGARSA